MSWTPASSFCFANTSGYYYLNLWSQKSRSCHSTGSLIRTGRLSYAPCRSIHNSWETFLPLGTCQQIAEKMTGVENLLFSWLYGLSDCTDVNHFRYEMPKETFRMMLTIRYPAMAEGGGDADLSLVTPCRSLKMDTDHVIYQCPVQKTVNDIRTNGKTRNMAWVYRD